MVQWFIYVQTVDDDILVLFMGKHPIFIDHLSPGRYVIVTEKTLMNNNQETFLPLKYIAKHHDDDLTTSQSVACIIPRNAHRLMPRRRRLPIMLINCRMMTNMVSIMQPVLLSVRFHNIDLAVCLITVLTSNELCSINQQLRPSEHRWND